MSSLVPSASSKWKSGMPASIAGETLPGQHPPHPVSAGSRKSSPMSPQVMTGLADSPVACKPPPRLKPPAAPAALFPRMML